MTIVRQELKLNVKSLFIWALVVGGFTFIFMLIFPEIGKQSAEMMEIYGNLGVFSEAFGMDKINFTTALGFYGIEAGAMISVGGAMFAALIGTGILCKEEGNHTAEFLLTMPVSRFRILSEKLLATTIIIVAFNSICFVFGCTSFIAIGEELELKKLIMYHFAQLVMQLEIGYLCFGISAFLKRNSVGLGIGIAVLLYFLNMYANISEDVEFLKYVTPFYYSDAAEIFTNNQIDFQILGIGVVVGILALLIGYIKYIKKDISA